MIKHSFLILGLLVSIIKADDGGYSYNNTGGSEYSVYPVKNIHIKMVKEEVRYDYRTEKFETIFWMLNTSSEKQRVTIGFPFNHYLIDQLVENPCLVLNEQNYHNELKLIEKEFDFKSWINGKRAERKLYFSEGDYKLAYVKDLIFEPKEEMVIKNTYTQSFGKGNIATYPYYTSKTLDYILTTGASWKDSIDEASFEFILPKEFVYPDTVYCFDEDILKNKLSYFIEKIIVPQKDIEKYKINALNDTTVSLSWTVTDLEPDQNIEFKTESYEQDRKFHSSGYPSTEYFNMTEFQEKSFYISKLISTNSGKDSIDNALKDFIEFKKNYTDGINFYRQYSKYYFRKLLSGYSVISKKELDTHIILLLNFISALNQQKFDNKHWTDFFSSFSWYKPVSIAQKTNKNDEKMIKKINTIKTK